MIDEEKKRNQGKIERFEEVKERLGEIEEKILQEKSKKGNGEENKRS